MSETPTDRLVKQSVRCTKCGAKYGKCDCWTECRCGWLYERGEQCRNPIHKTGVFKSEGEQAAGMDTGKDGEG
jgi:hypothetical protein